MRQSHIAGGAGCHTVSTTDATSIARDQILEGSLCYRIKLIQSDPLNGDCESRVPL